MSSFDFHNPLDFFYDNAEQRPTAVAYIFKGISSTYGELLIRVEKQMGWLADKGIRYGSKVALFSDNDFSILTSTFAVWSLGAVVIPINIEQTSEKLLQIIETVEPDIVLSDMDTRAKELFKCEVIGFNGDTGSSAAKVEVGEEDRAIIMFTSGTSGVPKAVPITYRALGHNCFHTAQALAISPDDRILINSPPYFTSAIVHNLTMFSGGASVVVDRSMLLANAIFELIEKYECTGFGGVPVHFARIEGCLESSGKPDGLRFLMNSGEHLPVPLLKKVHDKMPDVEIFCVYGLTEVAGRFCILPPKDLDRKAGSVGKPLAGMEVSVRDDSGQQLQPHELGEVYVSGITLMSGYLNNDIANQKSMKEYGFATGDIGKIDEDGYVFLEGRTDDVMKVGGEKVSLKMIEESALSFPPVGEVIAVPIQHDLMGSVPCLYYTLKPGGKLKKKEILKYLRGKLPSSHVPAFLEEIDEIPRASSGKKLRSFFAAQ